VEEKCNGSIAMSVEQRNSGSTVRSFFLVLFKSTADLFSPFLSFSLLFSSFHSLSFLFRYRDDGDDDQDFPDCILYFFSLAVMVMMMLFLLQRKRRSGARRATTHSSCSCMCSSYTISLSLPLTPTSSSSPHPSTLLSYPSPPLSRSSSSIHRLTTPERSRKHTLPYLV